MKRVAGYNAAGLAVASFVLFLSGVSLAYAHVVSYGAIRTTLTAHGSQVDLSMVVPQNLSYSSYFDQKTQHDLFAISFQNKFVIEQTNKLCPFALDSYDNTSSVDRTSFKGTFTCPAPITGISDLVIRTDIFAESFQTFDHFVTLNIEGKQWTLLFTKSAIEYPSTVSAQYAGTTIERFIAVSRQFTLLGMEHIWTGYDHILFLLSLILLIRKLKDVLLLVTSFTLAHSITLILAGLQIFTLPSRVVEPLIALSIAYVAFGNARVLYTKKDSAPLRRRWMVTFGFGLIHGLGFATALAETTIPSEFFIPALVIFNVGIELGQLAILAVAIPLFRALARLPERRLVYTNLSLVVGAVASFWVVERIFF